MYGGTKKEMERLLADANKLNAAQGKHTKYSIENYADIISAIHDVQVNMGIYGTTANEAQSTIQGSLNMTKAAWENLLVGIADDSADFDTLIDNLIESATAAGKNLIPRVEQVIKGIGRAIEKLLPVALEEIPKAISRYAPEVLTALGNLISIVYTSFNNLLTNTDWSGLGESLANKINEIDWATLFHDVGETIMNGLRAALDFTTGFLESIDWEKLGEDIVNSLTEFGKTIDWGAIVSGLFELLGAAIGGASSLLIGVAQALWDNFKAALAATWDYFGQYIDEAGGNVIEGLFNGIINALSSIGSWIYNNIFKPFIDGFKNAFGIHSPSTVMKEMGDSIVSGLVNGVKEMPGKIWNFLVLTVQKAVQFGLDMKDKAVKAAKLFFDSVVDGLKDLPGKLAEVGDQLVKGLWNGIRDVKEWILKKIQGFGRDVLDAIKGFFGIKSPSRKTAEIGRFLVKGLAVGLEDEREATKAAEKLSDDVIKAFNSDGLTMSMNALPDLNADLTSSITAESEREESQTIALLTTILNAIYAIDDNIGGKIQKAIDNTDIRWNDRELGRLIKTYA